MIKRLASIAILSLPLSLLSSGSASAADCGVLGAIGGCMAPAPAPSTSPSPSPQPSSSPPPSSSPQPAAKPAPAPAPAPARSISEVSGAADRLMQLVNSERGSHGLRGLSMRGDVVAIAHPHSRDMASKRTIWHNDGYFSDSTRASLRSSSRGENVAMNSSLEDAHRRLMNSPGHRANILNGGFTQAGFSVVQDEAGTLYVTQNFMTPESDKATAAKPKSSKAKATKAKSSKTKATKAKSSKKRATKAQSPRRARTAKRSR
ncbi:MAG TPA: CAP domain-containing protein [Acidimicrobiales bacterium]|nr:CAP domain-containing protein [Acidimicrobiales bacterium]